jgi:dodecin
LTRLGFELVQNIVHFPGANTEAPGGAWSVEPDKPSALWPLGLKGTRQFSGAPSFQEGKIMASVYKVIEIIGSSPTSWEAAAEAAVERASETLRDLRVAEVTEQDVQVKDGKIELYRTKLKISFKFEEKP